MFCDKNVHRVNDFIILTSLVDHCFDISLSLITLKHFSIEIKFQNKNFKKYLKKENRL